MVPARRAALRPPGHAPHRRPRLAFRHAPRQPTRAELGRRPALPGSGGAPPGDAPARGPRPPPPRPFTPADSLVQLILTAPEHAFLSGAPTPLPFNQRHLLSPFPGGEIPVASDKAAPSRAFAKLVEAELRLGRGIQSGDTCVDLGAAPGSWTYVAVRRGARVTAVDRSPLRDDLLHDPRVHFQPGDAFRYFPPHPVDWLLCDVIAAPERTATLLVEWLRHRRCRHFIVTLKTRDAAAAGVLERLKRELPPLTSEWFLTRLCANKKEICAFGAAG